MCLFAFFEQTSSTPKWVRGAGSNICIWGLRGPSSKRKGLMVPEEFHPQCSEQHFCGSSLFGWLVGCLDQFWTLCGSSLFGWLDQFLTLGLPVVIKITVPFYTDPSFLRINSMIWHWWRNIQIELLEACPWAQGILSSTVTGWWFFPR